MVLQTIRDVKLPAYAKAGIPEVWIVDLMSECIEVHQGTTPSGYRSMKKKKTADILSLPLFPDITITVNWVLGKT